jgi:hypothetical protein
MKALPAMHWARLTLLLAVGSCASLKPTATGQSQGKLPDAKSAEAVTAPAPSCERSPAAGLAIDLAVPAGFTEICGKDRDMCANLTAGYPPTVRTIGYFVPSSEWARYQRGDHSHFKKYLIAQLTTTSTSDFPAMKTFIRGRSGRIPDSSRIRPDVLRRLGRVDLGVLDEGPDFISPGVLLSVEPSPQMPALEPQVAINTAFLRTGVVFSLYTHYEFAAERDVDACRQLTTQWLACLRSVLPSDDGTDGPPARTTP